MNQIENTLTSLEVAELSNDLKRRRCHEWIEGSKGTKKSYSE